MDFVRGRRRLEIEQGLDVAAHHGLLGWRGWMRAIIIRQPGLRKGLGGPSPACYSACPSRRTGFHFAGTCAMLALKAAKRPRPGRTFMEYLRATLSAAFALISFGAIAADYPAPKHGEWIAQDFKFHTGE